MQTQATLSTPVPSLGFASLEIKDPMSFSLALGVIIVAFVLVRHVISRARHTPL